MLDDPYDLGPIQSSYTDYIGTTVAERSAVKKSGNMYELAGLDRERWLILGWDVHAFSHGAPPRWRVSVYAFDREANDMHGPGRHEDLKELEAREGALPVTEVFLHDVDFEDVIKCMKSVSMRFLSRNFQNLRVIDRGEHPAQD